MNGLLRYSLPRPSPCYRDLHPRRTHSPRELRAQSLQYEQTVRQDAFRIAQPAHQITVPLPRRSKLLYRPHVMEIGLRP
jgi:hypothetical protein